MSSRQSPQASPWWKRPGVLGTAVALITAGLMVLNTTFVSGSLETPADTAVEYAELNYTEFVVPSITDRAVPVAELATSVLEDPEGTGAELGRREDELKPFSYAVSGTGTVTDGPFGEVGLEVEGMPEGITVGVAVPPLGSVTALRDAGTELTFGDFVNQTEYQRVAVELNTMAAQSAYGDIDLAQMNGETITVLGAVTWSSSTGGEVDHVTIIPVSVQEGP